MKMLPAALVVVVLMAVVMASSSWGTVHAAATSNDAVTASVVCTSTDACKVYHGTHAAGAQAWCTFSNNIAVTGWGELELWMTSADDTLVAYAAGFLEAALTQELMWNHYNNFMIDSFNTTSGPLVDKASKFLMDNYNWVKAQSAQQAAASTYWSTVAFTYSQIDGLVAGYNSVAPSNAQFETVSLLFLNAQGDLGDIISAIDASGRHDFETMSYAQTLGYSARHSHCSSMVRYTPDMQQLFMGHNMWWSYYAMLRIFKTYHFGADSNGLTMQMSSYPGLLSSTDDFYQTSSGLVVMETTNDVFNNTLYTLIKPQGCVMSWARAVVCNRLAKDGSDWTSMFAMYNSGTYNNMWIVVDTNKFTPGRPLQPGTLMILEQLPGYTQAGDVTTVLSYGYWPSYNRPFFPETARLSGIDAEIAKFPNSTYFTYSGNPRANIFRRDVGGVTTLEEAKFFMRYNKWQTDPFSDGSAANQIAARYDLVTSTPPYEDQRSAGGAIDAKLTSASDVKAGRAHVICGPTHESQPVFKWSDWHGAPTPHAGQPDVFDFDWIAVQSTH